MWKGAVVLSCVLVAAAAYQAIAQLEAKPDKFKDVKGCYVSFLDRVIPVGETGSRPPLDDEECKSFHCWEDQVTISGCSLLDVQPPCTSVVQRDKPYPLCCPQPNCPELTSKQTN